VKSALGKDYKLLIGFEIFNLKFINFN